MVLSATCWMGQYSRQLMFDCLLIWVWFMDGKMCLNGVDSRAKRPFMAGLFGCLIESQLPSYTCRQDGSCEDATQYFIKAKDHSRMQSLNDGFECWKHSLYKSNSPLYTILACGLLFESFPLRVGYLFPFGFTFEFILTSYPSRKDVPLR